MSLHSLVEKIPDNLQYVLDHDPLLFPPSQETDPSIILQGVSYPIDSTAYHILKAIHSHRTDLLSFDFVAALTRDLPNTDGGYKASYVRKVAYELIGQLAPLERTSNFEWCLYTSRQSVGWIVPATALSSTFQELNQNKHRISPLTELEPSPPWFPPYIRYQEYLLQFTQTELKLFAEGRFTESSIIVQRDDIAETNMTAVYVNRLKKRFGQYLPFNITSLYGYGYEFSFRDIPASPK